VVDGGPVDFAVATSPATAALPPLDGAELPDDSHGRRGVFTLTAVAPIDLAFTSGAAEPAPVSIGDAALPNKRAGERPLGGDYGVVRPFALHLANTTAAPLSVYLYELTSGAGGATATLWFTGDTTATLVPCVDDSAQPHLIRAFTLSPSETRTVTGSFMTDGSASYPVRFGLTATRRPQQRRTAAPLRRLRPRPGLEKERDRYDDDEADEQRAQRAFRQSVRDIDTDRDRHHAADRKRNADRPIDVAGKRVGRGRQDGRRHGESERHPLRFNLRLSEKHRHRRYRHDRPADTKNPENAPPTAPATAANGHGNAAIAVLGR